MSLRPAAIITFVAAWAISCGGTDGAASPGASLSDVPRSAFPSGEEGRLAWARACLLDGSMALLLLPDLAYISARAPTPWWESTPHDTRTVRFASGGSATEYVSKDARDPRVSTTFTIRAERWQVDGRPDDPRYRGVVECAYARLEAR